MDELDLLLKIRANETGRSQPRRRYAHVHVTDAPFGIAIVQMAGESFSLWGGLVGPLNEEPRLLAAPEPRNQTIQLAALTELAAMLAKLVDGAASGARETLTYRNDYETTRCLTVPQLMVSNGAVVSLLDRLGRRMRGAGYSGLYEVPEVVNVAGAHLGFYAESAKRPGSSLCIVAADELARHWASGQSAFEDDHLGTQLAWLDPAILDHIDPSLLGGRDTETTHGAEAASLVEEVPMGVLTDPRRDADELMDLVMEFNRERDRSTELGVVRSLGAAVREALESSLRPTWNALVASHAALADLTPAASVPVRWENDRHEFTRHVEYVSRGGRTRAVDSVRRAALILTNWEQAATELAEAEVLEDPLGMVEAIARGDAVEGEVSEVDPDHTEQRGNRSLSRPLLKVKPRSPIALPRGTHLWWTFDSRLKTEVVSTKRKLVLKVVGGMNCVELPEAGDDIILTAFKSDYIPPPPLPSEDPWTHSPMDGSQADGAHEDIDDGPALDKVFGTAG